MFSQARYHVQAVDLDYYRRNIPCQHACPTHTDARGYVNAIARGDVERAYYIARQPNPFATACGRICEAPCEDACRRGKVDAPIPIRALKRFVTQRYGVEGEYSFPAAPPGHDNSHTCESQQAIGSRRGEGRVAVVGSGPAGLTAAHDLALMGHRVTVFEKEAAPGGAIMDYVPVYRLPREFIRLEVEAILRLGVDIQTGRALGREITIDGLKHQGYQAILLSMGLPVSRSLNIPGADSEGVLMTLPFLKAVNHEGYRLPPGKTVIVIGGGNVAIDTARSALRAGAKAVRLVCLESPDEMPAHPWEIEEAAQEGIEMNCSWGPKQIIAHNGKVTVLECMAVKSVFDEQGRFNPTFYEDRCTLIEGDIVILAIGQAADVAWLPEEGVPLNQRGQLAPDPDTMATGKEGVFACGEVMLGPGSAVRAIAHGHRAARAVDAFLQGKQAQVRSRGWLEPIDPSRFFDLPYLHVERQDPRRNLFPADGEMEVAYTEEEAATQARRCLTCNLQTVFDGQKCILCGGCVDVCPMSCLKLVGIDQVYGEAPVTALLEEDTPDGRRPVTAMIKDETRCIRCGLCQKRCPTGAVQLMAFWFEEEVVYD